MTLQEAIEIKLKWRKGNYPPTLTDEKEADMLSIEALKRLKELRDHPEIFAGGPLPGETDE